MQNWTCMETNLKTLIKLRMNRALQHQYHCPDSNSSKLVIECLNFNLGAATSRQLDVLPTRTKLFPMW